MSLTDVTLTDVNLTDVSFTDLTALTLTDVTLTAFTLTVLTLTDVTLTDVYLTRSISFTVCEVSDCSITLTMISTSRCNFLVVHIPFSIFLPQVFAASQSAKMTEQKISGIISGTLIN